MSQTLVLKIGTSSLTQPDSGDLALSTLARLVETLTQLRRQGHRLVLVSSGAVGVGCARLGLSDRPRRLATKQAVAAVGQGRLMRVYDDLFTSLQQPIAQILLTRKDLVQRSSYVNAYNTFQELLKLGVIPIVNENDTIATEELKFGDNDTLSAMVANLISADLLILLTDQHGLYDHDPRSHPDARLIEQARADDPSLGEMAGESGSGLGRGGMVTKIRAAQLAARSGTATVIAWGGEPQVLERIGRGENLGTLLTPSQGPQTARKRWIAGHLGAKGRIILDPGAVRGLREQGRSLLAVGVVGVEGRFARGDLVSCRDQQGREVARGLINYDSEETERIKGMASRHFEEILGYLDAPELIHRDNLALL